MNARYAAIILAGGLSTRMKQLKPLLPLDNETIVDHVITTFLSAVTGVYLVTGYRHRDVEAGVSPRHFTTIYNPDYANGMFTSVRAGVGRLGPDYGAFFIAPVDIPIVRPATVRRLMEEAGRCPGSIIYPVFGGKRGHPPLLPASIIPAILGGEKDGGLKAILAERPEPVLEVKVPDGNILFDIDTPEDYAALLERYRRYEIPTDEECSVILNDICRVTPERIRHNYKVAAGATAIGRALGAAGHKVDVEAVRIAAILHDIAKGQSKHDITGGNLLRELGFGKIGDIVGVHSDLAGGNLGLSLEAKVVFLADKLIEGEKPVTLEERYNLTRRPFPVTPEVAAGIMARLEVARQVKRQMESLAGRTMESIINPLP